MKSTAIFIAATAALVSAQGPTLDPSTGKYKCPKPNVAYCAGDSLKTDIIIRCDSAGNGQPGRCTDNLAGEPPVGLNTALCYQTDTSKGDAACEKNCVVYGGSGNGNGTYTLPAALCTPSYTATSSSTSTSYSSGYPTGTGGYSQTTITSTSPVYPTTTLTTSTAYSTVVPPPLSTGGSGSGGNGTYTSGGSGGGGSGGGSATYSATNTPPTPTKSGNPTSVPTAGASANKVGGALAAVGLVAAYFL